MLPHHLFTAQALIHEAADDFGQDTAVTDGESRLTFVELRDAALTAAAALRANGVKRGDRVGVCMAKSTDQAVAILGILAADAVLVPILPGLKHDNIEHIVRDCGARIAVTDAARDGELRRAAPDVRLLTAADLSAPAAAHAPAPQQSIGTDLAGIIYSSGSTGRPKGTMISHRNVHDGARIVARYLGIGRDDVIGSVLSLNFDYGLNQLWVSLLTGARLCLHELVFPTSLFRFLEAEKVTVLPLMPVMVTRIFDPRLLRRPPTADLGAVRCISSSGGPVPAWMLEKLTAFFPSARIHLMYGLTEAFRSTYLDPDELPRRPGSIGKAIPDVEILVLDERGRQVAPGEPGELVHRGGCVSKGYWNAPEATAQRFRSLPQFPGETLVFSGDLVTRDEEGFLYFQGRRDAMIKTSGFRVSPTEVEVVAGRYPGVDACVAVGLPNEDIGEDIVLAYTVQGDVERESFLDYLKASLPAYMVPHYLLPWPETFPSTGNQGKIDRQSVRSALLERRPPAADRIGP